MVMLGNTIPKVGELIDWDIEEILTRSTGDLDWYARDAEYCPVHNSLALESVEYDYFLENVCECFYTPNVDYIRRATLAERWKAVLEIKRADDHYGVLRDWIAEVGINRDTPLTAIEDADEDGNPVLVLRDGHHRLAAAIDLGMTTVPVLVCESFLGSIANDSGEWDGPESADDPDCPQWGLGDLRS